MTTEPTEAEVEALAIELLDLRATESRYAAHDMAVWLLFRYEPREATPTQRCDGSGNFTFARPRERLGGRLGVEMCPGCSRCKPKHYSQITTEEVRAAFAQPEATPVGVESLESIAKQGIPQRAPLLIELGPTTLRALMAAIIYTTEDKLPVGAVTHADALLAELAKPGVK